MRPLYPARRPVVGELVRLVEHEPDVIAKLTRVRRASNRSYYIVDVEIVQGCDREDLQTGQRFTSVSTCWLFDGASQPN